MLLQDPDTSGPKDPHTEVLKQRSCTSCFTASWYRDLAQVVLEDLDTSGPKASWYEILCKWSYRILIQVVQKDPYIQRWYRDLAQVLMQDPDIRGPKDHSHRDPETEILHKLSHRILIQRSRTSAPIGSWYSGPKDPATEILQVLLQNPDTSGPKDHSHRDPEMEILHKLSHRILIQRSCTSGPRGSWHKRFESILIRDLVQVVL